ncbi:hypothetical protein BHM03_00061570, partial [Ensete ventricosum]
DALALTLPPSTHRRRRCPAQVAVLHAVDVGSRPYGRRYCLRAAPRGLVASPRAGAAPASGRSCQPSPLQEAALDAGLPLGALQRAAATCGLAVAAAPCGRSWAAGPCGLAACGSPLRAGRSRSCLRDCCHYGWLAAPCRGLGRTRLPPYGGALAAAGCPLTGGPWLQPVAALQGGYGYSRLPPCRWPAAPARGLAMAMPDYPLQGLPSLRKCSKNM